MTSLKRVLVAAILAVLPAGLALAAADDPHVTVLSGQSLDRSDTDNGAAPTYRIEYDRPFAHGRLDLNVVATNVNGGSGDGDDQLQNIAGANLLVNFFPASMVRLSIGGGFSQVWKDGERKDTANMDSQGNLIGFTSESRTDQFLRWQGKGRVTFCLDQPCSFAIAGQLTYNDALDKDNPTRALEGAIGIVLPMP